MDSPSTKKSKLEYAFERFHKNNPQVWELFKKFTWEVVQAGHKKIGVAMIWERMRWYAHVETNDAQYKLNNNHRAYYARLWLKLFPAYPVFSTREVKK